MAKPWAKAFYNSGAWQRSRDGYIAHRVSIDGGLCEVCHERLGYIVHHKKKLTKQNIQDPEVALSWSNFSYECKQCHDKHEGHGVAKAAPALVLFDDEGNVIGRPPCFENLE